MTNKSVSLSVKMREGQTEDRAFAEAVLNPTAANAMAALDYSKTFGSNLSLQEVLNVMNDNAKQVKEGKLDYLESMLTSQATVLNSIFTDFARRAVVAPNVPQLEVYLRMAFKAQSQCRTTIEAIGELKYPKQATFIRQANIANQQQVNNGVNDLDSSTRTGTGEKNIIQSNELLTETLHCTSNISRELRDISIQSETSHATLDKGRTRKPSKTYSRLEAVGALNRSKDHRRKKEIFDE
jgi:hypothetical protein